MTAERREIAPEPTLVPHEFAERIKDGEKENKRKGGQERKTGEKGDQFNENLLPASFEPIPKAMAHITKQEIMTIQTLPSIFL